MTERERNQTIQENFPFIVKTVSTITKKYVEVGNSDELNIALEAFNDCLDHYDADKGKFYSYAKTVIHNKIVDYYRHISNHQETQITETDIVSDNIEELIIMRDELLVYKEHLHVFGLNYEVLISEHPKHDETRRHIIELAKKLQSNSDIMHALIEKKRLPVTLISREYDQSLKFVKSHKKTISAILIAYHYEIQSVIDFLGQ